MPDKTNGAFGCLKCQEGLSNDVDNLEECQKTRNDLEQEVF